LPEIVCKFLLEWDLRDQMPEKGSKYCIVWKPVKKMELGPYKFLCQVLDKKFLYLILRNLVNSNFPHAVTILN
jgi:hypothetical protein